MVNIQYSGLVVLGEPEPLISLSSGNVMVLGIDLGPGSCLTTLNLEKVLLELKKQTAL